MRVDAAKQQVAATKALIDAAQTSLGSLIATREDQQQQAASDGITDVRAFLRERAYVQRRIDLARERLQELARQLAEREETLRTERLAYQALSKRLEAVQTLLEQIGSRYRSEQDNLEELQMDELTTTAFAQGRYA